VQGTELEVPDHPVADLQRNPQEGLHPLFLLGPERVPAIRVGAGRATVGVPTAAPNMRTSWLSSSSNRMAQVEELMISRVMFDDGIEGVVHAEARGDRPGGFL